MLSDLNTIVFEFLRNWAVEQAIDYCLYRARLIQLDYEYLDNSGADEEKLTRIKQQMEITR